MMCSNQEGNACGGDDSFACTPSGNCAGGFCSGNNFPYAKGIPLRVPDKLIFIAEYFDREAEMVKKYMFNFYTVDGTVEILDIINNRRFLRRLKLDTVTLPDLFIGNVLNIYARHMTLTEYGDSCTRQYLEPKTERAFLMIKPEAVIHLGCVLQRLEKCFRIIRAKMAQMDYPMVSRFYQQHEGQEYFAKLLEHMCSGPVVAFLLVGENAIEKLKAMLGETDPCEAKLKSPTTLRALYGHDLIHNAFHAAESFDCVIKDSSFFFPVVRSDLYCVAPNTALLKCSTCCIIKPHAVKERLSGRIISDIVSGNYRITAFEMFYLDRTHAEEFYEIYKTVLQEYSAMTAELALGPCFVLEISGCDEDTPKAFRTACGPMDPELGRKLRPTSLRARYGIDKVHNAVHCTDLPEDGHMEVEYFFRILNMMS